MYCPGTSQLRLILRVNPVARKEKPVGDAFGEGFWGATADAAADIYNGVSWYGHRH